MHGPAQSDAAPPLPDGDGIRVIRRPPTAGVGRLIALAVTALGVAAGSWLLLQPSGPASQAEAVIDAAQFDAEPPVPSATARPVAARRTPLPRVDPVDPPESVEDYELPSLDPDDIAAYIRPGDEEPTMAELIDALRAAGIHEGIAAFNPPGTSPPLEGLAVPEDFELPEGYVRHYQATDQGEAIEAILMYSPDYEFYDESGRLVTVPEDRVVPEDRAPPGLPIRRVRIPPP